MVTRRRATAPGPRRCAARRRRRRARPRRARARVRAPLRRPRPPARRARRARLRRPDRARVPAAARAPARARAHVASASGTCSWTSTRTRTSRRAMLLRLLVRGAPQRDVVGDDDQAIYRFRGASRKNLARLPARASRTPRSIRLERNYRSGRRDPRRRHARWWRRSEARDREEAAPARSGGRVRFWRCAIERAQAQAVAAEVERLIARRRAARARSACWCARCKNEGAVVAAALEERGDPVPARRRRPPTSSAPRCATCSPGCALLADPSDSGAVVRALIAAAGRAALGRPRAAHPARAPAQARHAVGDRGRARGPAALARGARPRARVPAPLPLGVDARSRTAARTRSCMRLIERIGLRRQQVFATHADTVERLRNIAKLPELATAYMRREPQATRARLRPLPGRRRRVGAARGGGGRRAARAGACR